MCGSVLCVLPAKGLRTAARVYEVDCGINVFSNGHNNENRSHKYAPY